MESSGICGTGRPVGPDGKGGSCGFLGLRCPLEVSPKAVAKVPRHRKMIPAYLTNFCPVPIVSSNLIVSGGMLQDHLYLEILAPAGEMGCRHVAPLFRTG